MAALKQWREDVPLTRSPTPGALINYAVIMIPGTGDKYTAILEKYNSEKWFNSVLMELSRILIASPEASQTPACTIVKIALLDISILHGILFCWVPFSLTDISHTFLLSDSNLMCRIGHYYASYKSTSFDAQAVTGLVTPWSTGLCLFIENYALNIWCSFKS